jgi:hypothetical protein
MKTPLFIQVAAGLNTTRIQAGADTALKISSLDACRCSSCSRLDVRTGTDLPDGLYYNAGQQISQDSREIHHDAPVSIQGSNDISGLVARGLFSSQDRAQCG